MTPILIDTEDDTKEPASKKRRTCDEGSVTITDSEEFYLNIRDRKYARDLRPLV